MSDKQQFSPEYMETLLKMFRRGMTEDEIRDLFGQHLSVAFTQYEKEKIYKQKMEEEMRAKREAAERARKEAEEQAAMKETLREEARDNLGTALVNFALAYELINDWEEKDYEWLDSMLDSLVPVLIKQRNGRAMKMWRFSF